MMLTIATCLAMSLAPTNAAEVYQELTERILAMDQTDEDLDTLDWIGVCIERGAPLDERMLAFFHESQREVLTLTRRATDIEHCDFELPLKEEGYDLLLPHLSGMIGGARVLADQARAGLFAGTPGEMVEQLKALYQLRRHLISEDQTIIAGMVSISLARMARDVIQSALDRGEITPAMASPLARTMDFTASPDPFGIRAGMAMERVTATTWLSNKIGLNNPALDPDSPLPAKENELARSSFSRWQSFSDGSGAAPGWTSLSVGELRADVQQMDKAFDLMLAAMDDPDRPRGFERAQSIVAQVAAGEHGMLARGVMPGMNAGALEQQITALEDFATCREQLLAIAAGHDGGVYANAGELWIRAGRLSEPLGAAWIEAPDVSPAIDALLLQSLETKRRTYPTPWEDYLEAPVPWWLPGQVAVLDGLIQRIDRNIAGEQAALVLVDLEITLRMLAALAEDPRIGTSMAAVDALTRLTPLMERFAAMADETARRKMTSLVRGIPTRDAAGLQRATHATRERLRRHIAGEDFATRRFPDTNAEIPLEDDAVLSCVAWMRGWAGAQSPAQHVVPTGNGATIDSLDADILTTWHQLGAGDSPPLGFGELPATGIDTASRAHTDAIERMRAALGRSP